MALTPERSTRAILCKYPCQVLTSWCGRISAECRRGPARGVVRAIDYEAGRPGFDPELYTPSCSILSCLNMRIDAVPLGKALYTTFLTPPRCEWACLTATQPTWGTLSSENVTLFHPYICLEMEAKVLVLWRHLCPRYTGNPQVVSESGPDHLAAAAKRPGAVRCAAPVHQSHVAGAPGTATLTPPLDHTVTRTDHL
ncbi:hypothetical protein Bbelb_081480 [Branchiostoma belcheri]|nr:hypothetical protein Bbelb_081480 [Branchiostoma belcheri]